MAHAGDDSPQVSLWCIAICIVRRAVHRLCMHACCGVVVQHARICMQAPELFPRRMHKTRYRCTLSFATNSYHSPSPDRSRSLNRRPSRVLAGEGEDGAAIAAAVTAAVGAAIET